MKKYVCLLLILVLICGLAACEEPAVQTSFASFRVGETSIALNADAEPILTALGTPIAYGETNSCFGDGKDKVYEYVSFKVYTYSTSGREKILSVEIFSDADESVATPEGLRIGESLERVISLYGDANTESDLQLTYRNDALGAKLRILLRDGVVTNISYQLAESSES